MKWVIILLLLCEVCVGQTLPIYVPNQGWVSTVSSAPVGSTINYFETAKMTSNTSAVPAVVSADSIYQSGFEVWRAFDKENQNDRWVSSLDANPHWIQYDCGVGVSQLVRQVTVDVSAQAYTYGFKLTTVRGSTDATNWSVLYSNTFTSAHVNDVSLTSVGYYRYYRIDAYTYYAAFPQIGNIDLSSSDFNGAMMSASNAPSPYNASADSFLAGYPAWQAFDKDYATVWYSALGAPYPKYLMQDMGSNVVINGFTYTPYYFSPVSKDKMKAYVYSASLDATNWVTQNSGTFPDDASSEFVTNSNTTAYRYYKLSCTNGWDTANDYVSALELTFKHYK